MTAAIDTAALQARIAELEAQLEHECIRLAACGVAALSNTRETIAERITSNNSPFYSGSYQDVCNAVDKQVDYREKLEAMAAAHGEPSKAEPVFPELPKSLYQHPNLGAMWDRFAMHSYAAKHAEGIALLLDAASKAGSAEQVSERVAYNRAKFSRDVNFDDFHAGYSAAIQSAPERKESGIQKILGDWQSNFVCRTEQKEPERKALSDAAIRELAHLHLNGTGDHCIINFARALLAQASAQSNSVIRNFRTTAEPSNSVGANSARTADHVNDAVEMVLAHEWQPLTKSGQVKVGDKLRFTLCDEKINRAAKLILHAGTDQEEIIYDKGRNYYLITSMAIAGKASQKNVEFLPATRNNGGKP